jgi:hypothetical protein
MFAATTTNSKFDSRSQCQQALDRESVRTQCQEIGLDDGAVAIFADDHVDPTAPIFRRSSTAPRLFKIDLAGEWARA